MLKTIVTFSNTAFRNNEGYYKAFIKAIENTQKFHLIYKWFESPVSSNPSLVYSTFLKDLQKVDVVIAEASVSSIGVGQTIAIAYQNKKNIVICMKKSLKDSNLHPLLRGISSSFVKYIYYEDLDDLQKKLVKLYTKLDTVRFEKFNFLATPEIKNILNEESKKLRITQSELLRNIITDWSKQKHGK